MEIKTERFEIVIENEKYSDAVPGRAYERALKAQNNGLCYEITRITTVKKYEHMSLEKLKHILEKPPA